MACSANTPLTFHRWVRFLGWCSNPAWLGTSSPAGRRSAHCPALPRWSSSALRTLAIGISWSFSAPFMRSVGKFASLARIVCSREQKEVSSGRSAAFPLTGRRAKTSSARPSSNLPRHDDFVLIVAAEGTRDRTDKWKTGFYHIARQAGVPIVCAGPDYPTKKGIFGPVIWPTGDYDRDMKPAFDFFRSLHPLHPERAALSRPTP